MPSWMHLGKHYEGSADFGIQVESHVPIGKRSELRQLQWSEQCFRGTSLENLFVRLAREKRTGGEFSVRLVRS